MELISKFLLWYKNQLQNILPYNFLGIFVKKMNPLYYQYNVIYSKLILIIYLNQLTRLNC